MGKNKKQGSKCLYAPTIFATVICFVLIAIIAVLNHFSLASDYYIHKIEFASDMQFPVTQMHAYDSLVLDTTQKKDTSIYVYKPGHQKKLQPTGRSSTQFHEVNAALSKGDAAVIPFFYVDGSFMEATADYDNGVDLKFKLLTPTEYVDYSPKGKIRKSSDGSVSNGLGGSWNELQNYTSFGMYYAALENHGVKGKVNFRVTVVNPLFKVGKEGSVEHCANKSSCKVQQLPNDFFAMVNVHVSEANKTNKVTVTEQYRDFMRWQFPLAAYILLVLIPIFTLLIQCCMLKRGKGKVNSYSAISDPLDYAGGRGSVN